LQFRVAPAGTGRGATLSQSATRPDRYGEPSRFDTMPSQPSLRVDDGAITLVVRVDDDAVGVVGSAASRRPTAHSGRRRSLAGDKAWSDGKALSRFGNLGKRSVKIVSVFRVQTASADGLSTRNRAQQAARHFLFSDRRDRRFVLRRKAGPPLAGERSPRGFAHSQTSPLDQYRL